MTAVPECTACQMGGEACHNHRREEAMTVVQHVATLPEDHPDLGGGQVLVRSYDGGQTWEVCTRPDHYARWSLGVETVSA